MLFRFVGCAGRINGACVLSSLLRCLRTALLQISPHRWRIFWHRFSTYAIFCSSRPSSETLHQNLCSTVRSSIGVHVFASGNLCNFSTDVKIARICDSRENTSNPLSVSMDSKSVQWPTSCSTTNLRPSLRALSRPL